MKEESSCKNGLKSGLITDDVFKREITLCKKLNKEKDGRCCWGKCQSCGVIPFLYKLNKGELLEKPEEIEKAKKDIFGD